MDKLRVALVGPYPTTEGSVFGGVEAVTSSLADGLAEVEGIELHTVTAVKGLRRPTDRISSSGVHIHSVPLFGTLGCLTGFAIDRARVAKKLREINPDILHVHTQVMYAHTGIGREWPSVLTIHGILERETASRRGLGRLQANLALRYEAANIGRARHLIAINRYSINAYGSIIRGDVRYIDNSIKDFWFDVPDRAEPGRILFGGFIYDLKNVLYLVQAIAYLAKKYPHIRLRVAGGVRDREYYNRCVSFVAEQGISKNVDFLGAMSVDEMAEEQSKASIVALTSKQENAPVIISEGMAAGNPVVATNVGGVAEMVADGESGFVVELDDVGTLAGRIDQLLCDEDLRKRMGEAGKAIAMQRFRRSVVVGKSVDYYREIVEREKSCNTDSKDLMGDK